MKIMLINGSPHANGCTYTALEEMAKVMNTEGIETQVFHIGMKPIPAVLLVENVRRPDAVLLMIVSTNLLI